jgi:hypothetical protein
MAELCTVGMDLAEQDMVGHSKGVRGRVVLHTMVNRRTRWGHCAPGVGGRNRGGIE